jgi:hypothetical protein
MNGTCPLHRTTGPLVVVAVGHPGAGARLSRGCAQTRADGRACSLQAGHDGDCE